ncbi:hypothetical protein [Leisingera daeponensis]|uniref:hypothetical protein n=1 Tax=Leisingera daeponensis TaxID=405746 RepID=UPI001C9543C5|nr:hypothetical protein [Leisingera daeponensis]MBY6058311.1 hypothetical protein [Leisingera daeponensis]
MLWKDYMRIGGLAAAIALACVLPGAQQPGTTQGGGWIQQIEEITPVQVDTVKLPAAAAFSA